MTRPMADLVLPTTDTGVAVQFALRSSPRPSRCDRPWSRPTVRLLVIGLTLTLFGHLGLRAAH